MRKIFVVYRENDLFKKYESSLIETLKSLDYKNETKIFPRETDLNEIAKWIIENKKNLEGEICLSDKTCAVSNLMWEVNSELMEEISSIEDSVEMVNLDDIFAWATYQTALKELGKATAGELVPKIVQRILEKNEMPQKVIIVSSHYLLSHKPFQRDDKSKLSPCDLEKEIKKATEKIKGWLVEGGIPEDKITISYYDETFDKTGNWIVFDRHEFNQKKEQRPKEAIKLQLPLENFYQDAAEQSLISFSEEELNKQLGKFLKIFLPNQK